MLRFNDYIKVGIADYKVASYPNGLATLGLGSCIGICVYDIKLRVGGLSHIMLPDSQEYRVTSGSELKYADLNISLMLDEMYKMGCAKKDLRAVIVGGGNMFINSSIELENSIGYKNQIAVKNILKSLYIPIVSSDLGGNIGKTVYFCLESGDVHVKKGLEIEIIYEGKKRSLKK